MTRIILILIAIFICFPFIYCNNDSNNDDDADDDADDDDDDKPDTPDFCKSITGYLFCEDWQEYDEGDEVRSPWVNESHQWAEIYIGAEEENRFLHVFRDNLEAPGLNVFTVLNEDLVDESMVFQFDVYIEDPFTYLNVGIVFDDEEYSTGCGIGMFQGELRIIINWENCGEVSYYSWHTVQVEFDLTKGTQSVYVNDQITDECTDVEMVLQYADPKSLEKMTKLNIFASGKTSLSYYLDNLVVYTY